MKPGTPLPWEWLPDEGQFIVTPEPQRAIVAEVPCQGAHPEDGAYIVHAANTLPRYEAALGIISESMHHYIMNGKGSHSATCPPCLALAALKEPT